MNKIFDRIIDIEKDLNDLITDIQTQVEFCELNEGAILEAFIVNKVEQPIGEIGIGEVWGIKIKFQLEKNRVGKT